MKDNNRVRGGQLLAKSFKEKGINHVFTLAGGFCNPALEGFMNHQIPVINCPHEQLQVIWRTATRDFQENPLSVWLDQRGLRMLYLL